MKRNGFLTVYMLWLGAIILTMAVAAASLAQVYVQNARHYAEAVRLVYAAESVLLVEWDDFVQTPWRDVPRKRRKTITDKVGIAGPDHTVEWYVTSDNPQALPFVGFLRVSVMNDKMQAKSCGLAFRVEPGTEGKEETFTIRWQEY